MAKYDAVRSFRMDDSRWERARRRAAYDGVSMSHVIGLLVDGYAAGQVNLPKVQVVYKNVKKEEA